MRCRRSKTSAAGTRESLAEILTVLRGKYVRTQSMATAKYKFQHLVFNPANQKLIDFLEELQKLAKDAFGVAAQANIDQFIYAAMPPHLKKSINQSHLGNGTYEKIVTHLERELELNSLEHPDDTQMNTVTHQQRIEGNKDNAAKIKSDTHDSNPNNYKNDRNSRTVYPLCETCGKTNSLRREMLCWSQCSKQATSLEEQTSTTGRTGQYNWLCPGYNPTS